ncbi:hypothetical protein [Desulfovibrio oxyclinae]|uniref:hypothetical protein n=1 Tax=Desulfovibrio oxyclinae TaxID=63560 RepID=UPI000365EA05|nr:hypothetical protein [Desulfovibrio oxyclinae]
MKLDITLVGNYHALGLLRLNRYTIKQGVQSFGSRRWTEILNGIAYGPQPENLQQAVEAALGKRVEVPYSGGGVLLDDQFGMEVFLDNEEYPCGNVDGTSRLIRPEKFMTGFRKNDMLCECKASGIGALKCRWEFDEEFDERKIRLEYDDLREVLNKPKAFEVVTMVTYDGKQPDRLVRDGGEGLTPSAPVYRIS